jgi:hypothetical protein
MMTTGARLASRPSRTPATDQPGYSTRAPRATLQRNAPFSLDTALLVVCPDGRRGLRPHLRRRINPLHSQVDGRQRKTELRVVLYAPSLACNLVSVDQLNQRGLSVPSLRRSARARSVRASESPIQTARLAHDPRQERPVGHQMAASSAGGGRPRRRHDSSPAAVPDCANFHRSDQRNQGPGTACS